MQRERNTAGRSGRSIWKRAMAVFLAFLLISTMLLTQATNILLKSSAYKAGSIAETAASYMDENTEYIRMDRLGRITELLNATLNNQRKYADYYRLASASIARGDYGQALTEIGQCLKLADQKDPKVLADLWMKKGALLALTNSYDEALECFARVLVLDDTVPQAYYLQAQIRLERKEYQTALWDLERYVSLAPEDAQARGVLGEVYEALGKREDALTIYDRLLSGQDVSPYAGYYLSRARLRVQAEEYDAAVQDYDAYLALKEDTDGSVHVMRAALRMQKALYADAVADFYAAIDLKYADPALCYEQAAICQYMLGNYQAVIRDGGKAVEMRGGTLEKGLIHQQMGLAAMALLDYENAWEYLDRSIAAEERPQGSFYYRGVCAMVLERNQDAVEDFAASIEEDFQPQHCYYNRGVCYLRLEDYENAESDMRQVLETGEDEELIASATDVLAQLASFARQ